MENSPFNKSFFKFLAGFIVIITISVITVFIVGAYEVNKSQATPPQQAQD